MNKTQLIESISEQTSMTKGEVKRMMDSLAETVIDTLSKGDKVAISGFGTFTVAGKQGRVGRDPRNGQQINIAPKKVVRFRAGVELNDQIN